MYDNSGIQINNGRYCRTLSSRDGIYAYFATITGEDSTNKTPVFPYFIADQLRDDPL